MFSPIFAGGGVCHCLRWKVELKRNAQRCAQQEMVEDCGHCEDVLKVGGVKKSVVSVGRMGQVMVGGGERLLLEAAVEGLQGMVGLELNILKTCNNNI